MDVSSRSGDLTHCSGETAWRYLRGGQSHGQADAGEGARLQGVVFFSPCLGAPVGESLDDFFSAAPLALVDPADFVGCDFPPAESFVD